MKKFITYSCALALLVVPIGALAQDGHEGHNHENVGTDTIPVIEPSDHDEHDEVVSLSQEVMDEFGIETAIAGPGTLHIQILVPGEVVVNYDRLAHIAPRFPGVVKQVNKRLGDKVSTGDILAVIESNEALTSYEVRALLDGTVIEKHITIGEVRSEETPAFVIADLSNVWANLSIYQKHLPHVRIGQSVVVSAGEGIPDVAGRISYVSPIVDKHTRTATARVVLDNSEGYWRPGLFIEGRISLRNETIPILVPKSALQQFENETVIFVETLDGFEPQPVLVGQTDLASVEILSGLKDGQKYVSKGGFTIKAELEKSSLGSGHSH